MKRILNCLLSVMRTQGSLRVILNAKIWSGMNVERASTKAIRITATDADQTVKIFLIVVSHVDPVLLILYVQMLKHSVDTLS